MVRDYFISFDYWGAGGNKFYNGVITVDLSQNDLQDVVRDIIDGIEAPMYRDRWQQKVVTLNNIEI
jgi:hypothetical protein